MAIPFPHDEEKKDAEDEQLQVDISRNFGTSINKVSEKEHNLSPCTEGNCINSTDLPLLGISKQSNHDFNYDDDDYLDDGWQDQHRELMVSSWEAGDLYPHEPDFRKEIILTNSISGSNGDMDPQVEIVEETTDPSLRRSSLKKVIQRLASSGRSQMVNGETMEEKSIVTVSPDIEEKRRSFRRGGALTVAAKISKVRALKAAAKSVSSLGKILTDKVSSPQNQQTNHQTTDKSKNVAIVTPPPPSSSSRIMRTLETNKTNNANNQNNNTINKNNDDSPNQINCMHCGIKTHSRVGQLSVRMAPVTNENVYNGVCIECFPERVPARIVAAWKDTKRQNQDGDV